METVTTRVDTDTHAEIEVRADETDQSKSAVARELIRRGLEYDEIRRERDRLREQLAATNRRVDEHHDLVKYVENELSYREAGLGTRMKWWLFGKS